MKTIPPWTCWAPIWVPEKSEGLCEKWPKIGPSSLQGSFATHPKPQGGPRVLHTAAALAMQCSGVGPVHLGRVVSLLVVPPGPVVSGALVLHIINFSQKMG